MTPEYFLGEASLTTRFTLNVASADRKANVWGPSISVLVMIV